MKNQQQKQQIFSISEKDSPKRTIQSQIYSNESQLASMRANHKKWKYRQTISIFAWPLDDCGGAGDARNAFLADGDGEDGAEYNPMIKNRSDSFEQNDNNIILECYCEALMKIRHRHHPSKIMPREKSQQKRKPAEKSAVKFIMDYDGSDWLENG